MKILVIEDDAKTAALMRGGLEAEGFTVDVCEDGEAGLALSTSGKFGLVILDLGLPRLDGWDLLQKLRAATPSLPVVVLTARDAVDHRVKGLMLGADDYMTKPFAFAELVARIRTVLRRTREASNDDVAFEDLRLDFRRHRAYRQDAAIELSGKEFELLELLLRHQGEVLSRDFISERVWDMQLDGSSNVVDVNIRRLRAKIDDFSARKLIQTVRGQGYVIR